MPITILRTHPLSFGLLLAIFAVVVPAGVALAHGFKLASAEVSVAERDVDIVLTVSAQDLAVALGVETDLTVPVSGAAFEAQTDKLDPYLDERLIVAADGERCAPEPATIDYTKLPEDLLLRIAFRCPLTIRQISLTYLLFFEIDAEHRNLGRIILPTGEEQEFLFDRELTRFDLEVAQPEPQLSWLARFARVLRLGVEHILTGYDHILFLLALLIVSARFWHIFKVVTAFTLAHSFTLALAWFGVVDLPSRLVESLIALSIAYVAVENILGKGFGHRWLVAATFGLVHGLGFYSALRELGLGGATVVTTLLAFNLGVELGQLVIVALVFGPLTWWVRQEWYRTSASAISAMILAVAGWWLAERIFAA